MSSGYLVQGNIQVLEHERQSLLIRTTEKMLRELPAEKNLVTDLSKKNDSIKVEAEGILQETGEIKPAPKETREQSTTTHEESKELEGKKKDNESTTTPPLHPSAHVEPATELFPEFGTTVFPVNRSPNWGAMRTPDEWNRTYEELSNEDFVRIPRYDLSVLTEPMQVLTNPITDETIPRITAKLFYSTRFMGKYDLDSNEYEGNHVGIDLKLALGTPVSAIAGGRVHEVSYSDVLGKYITIEHRPKDGNVYYSVYGHLASVSVSENDSVTNGQMIGYIGMTGNTSGPHLHLQVDRGKNAEEHVPFSAHGNESKVFIESKTIHPLHFIQQYRNG